MSMIRLLSFAYLLIPPLFSLGECCCCCDSDDPEQDPSGGGSSSSSCVSMSQEQCINIKTQASDWAQDAKTRSANVQNVFIGEFRPALQAIDQQIYYIIDTDLPRLQSIVVFSENVQSSLIRIVRNLETSRNDLRTGMDAFSPVGIGSLVVSNKSSSLVYSISGPHNPNVVYRRVIVGVTNAIQTLQSVSIPTNSLLTTEARSLKSDLISELESIENTVSGLILKTDLIIDEINAIDQDVTQVQATVAQIDCSPCSGGSGGSGGDGGGSSTVDLTPVVNAIHSFQDDFDDRLQTLYDLIATLVEDYSTASQSHISREDSIDFNKYLSYRGDNWFKGVEYLLYTLASDRLTAPAEPEYQPDDDGLSQLKDDVESNSASMSNSVSSASVSVSDSPLGRLKAKVDALFDCFSNFGFRSDSVSSILTPGVVVGDFTIDPVGISGDLSNSVSSVLDICRHGFIAFYYVSASIFVLSLLYFVFVYAGKIVRFGVSFYASLFGGAS